MMNKFSNYTELRTVKDLVRIPPGRYVAIGEAAEELNRQWITMMMPGIRTLFKAREHPQDWQWPQRWHGTLCLLSEREDVREAQ